MQQIIQILFFSLISSWFTTVFATTFPLPPAGNDIVGHVQMTVVKKGDDFSAIARRFDVGYYQMVEANPGVDSDHPPVGTLLLVPTKYILPPVREGIVVNVAELRLYYFPKGQSVVMTFPLGIGRQDWETPLGVLSIVQKIKNPTWYVPDSIRTDRAKDGVQLPKFVKPGPDNPLGDYAMRLSKWTYLIHGTNDPSGVGRRSSSGCLRLYPEDIEQLFSLVNVGVPVRIIDLPFKAGWQKNKLYLEAHLPLQEMQVTDNGQYNDLIKQAIEDAINKQQATVHWQTAMAIATEQQGLPQVIGYSQIIIKK